MNKIIKSTLYAAGAFALALGSTSCLEESLPETSKVTENQLENADKAGLASAISAFMTTYGDSYYDIGFAGFGVWRDAMTADLPIYETTFDYFTSYNYQNYLGDYTLQTLFWRRYYYLVQKCNAVLGVSNLDPESEDASSVGNALAYRAMAYMDMTRMYEFRPTGVSDLDQTAESRGIYGLTVPIVTEKTTEADSRALARAPYAEMVRFIMNDLNLAEKCLNGKTVAAKNDASIGVVYGLKARLWLELGSRFRVDSEMASKVIAAESTGDLQDLDQLGVSNANDCFTKAAEYARKAINSGYTPLSKNQWYDPVAGFNSVNNSWMWAIIITSDNGLATDLVWQSWPSYMCPEATYGVSTMEYKGCRMIDARLFETIDDNDWRRDTWIDPNDVGSNSAFQQKYEKTTSLKYKTWAEFPAYVGFKFHPANGDGSTSTNGNAVSLPLMRVEEMYLIEAEATAYVQGVPAGVQLLSNFLSTYRYSSAYSFTSNQIDDFVDEIFKQRRIEFWGEGLILWDYRRLLKPIERGYPGSNHPQEYWFNSYDGFVAPWTTLYIPDREHNQDQAIILNPDPSNAIKKWTNN